MARKTRVILRTNKGSRRRVCPIPGATNGYYPQGTSPALCSRQVKPSATADRKMKG